MLEKRKKKTGRRHDGFCQFLGRTWSELRECAAHCFRLSPLGRLLFRAAQPDTQACAAHTSTNRELQNFCSYMIFDTTHHPISFRIGGLVHFYILQHMLRTEFPISDFLIGCTGRCNFFVAVHPCHFAVTASESAANSSFSSDPWDRIPGHTFSRAVTAPLVSVHI